MFKPENVPNWLCALLALVSIIQQNYWRGQDMKRPLPELYFWILNGLVVLAIITSILWSLYRDKSSDPSKLRISYARWGAGGWWQRDWNVTKLVRSLVVNNSISNLSVSTGTFGDPNRGRGKVLTVKYSYAGFTRIIHVPEGASSYLVLPEQEVRDILTKMLGR